MSNITFNFNCLYFVRALLLDCNCYKPSNCIRLFVGIFTAHSCMIEFLLEYILVINRVFSNMTQQSTCITTLNLCIPSLFTFFCMQISHERVNFICEKSHIFLSVYLSSGLISCKDFDHDIHWSIFITFSRSKSSIYFCICSTEKV